MDGKFLEKILGDVIEKLHLLPDEDEAKPEGMEGMLGGDDKDDEDHGKAGIEIMKVMGDKKPMLSDGHEEDGGEGDPSDLLKRKLLGK